MDINFKTSHFSSIPNYGTMNVSWNEIYWSAITAGKKPNFYLKNPKEYIYEIIHKIFLIKTSLKRTLYSLEKTDLYEGMDPTEKGFTSYFLGMTTTKLFAEKYMGTPYLWDVSNALEAISYLPGNSRPDLIGLSLSNKWIVAEAKGRTNGFDNNALNKAKNQSRMISTINGSLPLYRFGSESYFNPHLTMELIDPPAVDGAIDINFNIDHALIKYYEIAFFIKEYGKVYEDFYIFELKELNLRIGLPSKIISIIEKNKNKLNEASLIEVTEINSNVNKNYFFEMKNEIFGFLNNTEILDNSSNIRSDGFLIEEIEQRYE